MMSENWKDVPGWEGLYQVSDMGRIRSFKTKPEGRVLSRKNKKGAYIQVILRSAGRPPRYVSLHRLVAEAFIPNPKNLPQVNHKDGDRQNNRASNLEWCTGAQNVRDAQRRNPALLRKLIYYNKYQKPRRVVQMTLDGLVLGIYPNARAAQQATGVYSHNILQVAAGTPYDRKGHIRRTAGGFVWRFESEEKKWTIPS